MIRVLYFTPPADGLVRSFTFQDGTELSVRDENWPRGYPMRGGQKYRVELNDESGDVNVEMVGALRLPAPPI